MRYAVFLLLLINVRQTLAEDNVALDGLVTLLQQVDDPTFQLDLLKGMHDALRGRRDVTMPKMWSETYARLSQSTNTELREKSLLIALIFHDPQSIESLKHIAGDEKLPVEQRQRAIQSLVESGSSGLAPFLQELTTDTAIRGAAMRALAAFSDAKTPVLLLSLYPTLNDAEKQDALHTLSSRPGYARALLAAIRESKVAARDVHSFTARQIDAFGDEELSRQLYEAWGEVRQTSADAQRLIAEYQQKLTPQVLAKANLANGRVLFNRTCAKCHTLYGEGGKIGPDITGGNRHNLYYILENILDPSASVAKQYQMTKIALEDGRILSGLVQTQPNGTIAIQTPTEQVIVPAAEILEQAISDKSMMPDGQLTTMTAEEVRDLIGYLQTR